MGLSKKPFPEPWKNIKFIGLQGKRRIVDLALFIENSRLVIANDSGPMPLAAALGVPVAAVFGTTSPVKYEPFPFDCITHQLIRAPQGDCKRLKVETVLERVGEILE